MGRVLPPDRLDHALVSREGDDRVQPRPFAHYVIHEVEMKPFTIHVTLHIRPECRADYRAALDKVIDHARALPQCRYLYVYETADDPDTIQLVESWSDWDTFVEEILRLDFYQEYAAASEPMYSAPREMNFLTPLHGSEWR